MKNFSIVLAIIALTLVGTFSNAKTIVNKVLIKETANHMINLKSSLKADETLKVIISHEDGELILEDQIEDVEGLISKTYDFNEARFGDYFIEVFINDELVESTVINENEVSFQNQFTLQVY